ncbi:MAG TPA: DUF86 domain-containing protein [Nitrospira sp.]|nr:DUF86 domain-containing protein [Nitrospira sp.]HNI69635.1 DUF86 domain-containing protein [Nitrospira sp.]
MADDVVLNKAASIERCLTRISEEYDGKREHLYENQTKQDAIVLNLQRACETAIDLAMYVVRRNGLGLPQESRDAFALLEKAGLLPAELANRLQRMVGFRNVAIHEYTRLNLDILQTIITKNLDDFRTFSRTIVKACG